jgi:thiamine pyrophosphate-dependent acetolactate synthase large subunit-like protein
LFSQNHYQQELIVRKEFKQNHGYEWLNHLYRLFFLMSRKNCLLKIGLMGYVNGGMWENKTEFKKGRLNMDPDEFRARFGSDIMADMLHKLDIKYAVINPGSSYRGLHDSIVNYRGNSKPEIILCTHEGIAISMAHGYGKIAGKPIAAMVHNVVGLLHSTMAIYNAWLDEAPLLVIGATGAMDIEKRRPWIEWVHTALIQGNVVRDYVKWDDQPSSLSGVPDSFIRAYQIATTDPKGPVYICLDAGLQEDPVTDEVPIPSMKRHPSPSSPQVDAAMIDQVAKLLVEATSPVVIADYMGRNPKAVSALIELAELLALPVIDAGGRFNFPNTHPLDLTGAERDLLMEADFILALDVHNLYRYLTTAAWDTRKIENIIPEKCCMAHFAVQHLATKSWSTSYGKLVAVDLPVTADTALALPLLTKACHDLLTEKRRAEIQKRYENLNVKHEALRTKWQTMAESEQNKSPIAISWLAKQVWEVIKNEDWALVYKDMRGWARRLWDWEKPYQYVGGLALGCGAGHSLGAALAHKAEGRLCIDFQADGDLLYTPAALWTASHHNIPLLVIMNNNRSYYNSELHQEMMAKVRERPVENKGIGTHIEDPPVDYARLARSFGLHGVGPIENPDELRPALEEAISVVKDKKQAALVDVVTQSSK